MAEMMRAQSQATGGAQGDTKNKAVIMIFLAGGVSHQDFVDLKPKAPKEVRGEFNPIATNVPGIEICELFPRMATMMDKFIPIRSICDADGRHDAFQCMTGWKKSDQMPRAGRPNFGAWVAHAQGRVNNSVPPNVSLCYPTGHREWGETPADLKEMEGRDDCSVHSCEPQ